MNKYEVMSNGEKIIVRADSFRYNNGELVFIIGIDGDIEFIANFKDWSYVRMV